MAEPIHDPALGSESNHTLFNAPEDLNAVPLCEPTTSGNVIGRDLQLSSPIPETPERGSLLIDQSHAIVSTDADCDQRFDASSPEWWELRKTMKPWIDAIVDHGLALGFQELHTRWMLDELITNALQYGVSTKHDSSYNPIRVEWEFLPDGTQHSLAFAVSNPSRCLFDPTRYARMTIADFFSMESSGTNAHEGTNTLLAFLKPRTPLNYLWELQDGGKIHLAVHPIPEDAPDKPADYDELKRPVTMDIFRTDASNRAIPYSFENFLNHIDQALPCERVTVSGMLSTSI